MSCASWVGVSGKVRVYFRFLRFRCCSYSAVGDPAAGLGKRCIMGAAVFTQVMRSGALHVWLS